jgi:uncharacterized Zn finger protein
MYYGGWRPYVSVAQRQAKAVREMDKRRKKGLPVLPVVLDGRAIARSFWGKAWCDHFDEFADFANRLPRGQRYVRNGSVCHLGIARGKIDAIVSGSELYDIHVHIDPLPAAKWAAIKQRCAGQIGSMLELLRGKFSDQVMAVVTDPATGLFPLPGEIKMDCSCPDWADLCKHLAAVLYGVGARLDQQPELLFTLRGVDSQELLAVEARLASDDGHAGEGKTLPAAALADVFGIELAETDTAQPPAPAPPARDAIPAAPPVPSAGADNSRRGKAKTAPAECPTSRRGAAKLRGVARTAGPAGEPAPAKKAKLQRSEVTGKLIADLRKQMRLSPKEFADALGVSLPSVHRWEGIPGPLNLYTRQFEALARVHASAGK